MRLSTLPRLRVMCVDDNEDSGESLGMLVDLFGCQVEVCYGGPAAMILADYYEPDVCLLDISMPQMDGCELASKLRACAEGRAMLIVAITAYSTEDARKRAAAAGFDHYLVKPVDIQALHDFIKDFANGHQSRFGDQLMSMGSSPDMKIE